MFKEVLDLNPDTVISLGGKNKKTGKPNPTSIEGYYLGKRAIEDRKKKSGKSYIYVFQTAQGSVGVWGKTDLDRKMLTATPGQMMRASFDRMVETPNGDMYKYKVEFDDSNTIEVAATIESNEQEGYSDDADFNNQESTDSEAEAYEQEELEAAATQLSAEKKAKVEAILNKGRKA